MRFFHVSLGDGNWLVRPSVLTPDPNFLAGLSGFLLLYLVDVFRNKNFINKWLVILGIVNYSFLIFATFSRPGLITLLVGLLTYFVSSNYKAV